MNAGAEEAYRLALKEAQQAWESWWLSEGTLFPDAKLLKAAKAAEDRLMAAFAAVHRIRFEAALSQPRTVREWAKVET